MAMMLLTSEDVGAPTLNGVNGALCNVLDWALVQNGWAIEYTASNARVYRPGSGRRRRLSVQHNSAVSGSAALATVRGCEDASAATTLIDAFPTTSQVANNTATWIASNNANSTARRYKIFLFPTFFLLLIDTNTSGEWDLNFFGDLEGGRTEDVYNTVISARQSSNVGSPSYGWASNCPSNSFPASLTNSNSRVYWCRDISGLYKSTKGTISTSGSNFGYATGAQPALAGYGNRLEREKVAVGCSGDNTPGGSSGIAVQARRGWIPNLWSMLHVSYAALSSEDTFADSEYDVSAAFTFFRAYSTTYGYAIETTETWSPPVG